MNWWRNLRGQKSGMGDYSSIAEDRRLILGDQSPFALSEAYRKARTNMMYLPIDDGCQKVAVTSSLPAEGKTLCSVNLAIVLAQSGKRVLLVDADMRKPRVERLLDLTPPGGAGLSEYLAGMTEGPTIVPAGRNGLDVLASGKIPPNPAELLSSPRVQQLFDGLKERYDHILLDTPPVSVVTDATVLSSRINGYLMVARAGYSDLEVMKTSVQALEQVGATIHGFVLTELEPKSGRYGYGKYGRYGRYDAYSRYGAAADT